MHDNRCRAYTNTQSCADVFRLPWRRFLDLLRNVVVDTGVAACQSAILLVHSAVAGMHRGPNCWCALRFSISQQAWIRYSALDLAQ